MDQRELLGLIAVGFGVAGYFLYLRNTFLGRTKPHAFSWLLWGLLTGIVFTAQTMNGAGAGAWVTGASCALCILIGFFGLAVDERGFVLFDWVFLLAGLAALLAWFAVKQPTMSIIIVTAVDVIGYASTLRKSYYRPHQETAMSFTLNSLKYMIALLALQSYSIITCLYPAALVIMNGAVAFMIALRRRAVSNLDEPVSG
jgi:hypothetical protein